jgi:DNA repair exonuclease SbcCD ATPase subunit
MAACSNNSAKLESKIAMLEKRLEEQDKKIKKVSGQYMPPRDFSSDIQRISDQQDRINEILRNKVDPINERLEEFREWARESQNEQTRNAHLIQQLEDELEKYERSRKALETNIKTIINDIGKLAIQVGKNRKIVEKNSKLAVNLAKEIRNVRTGAGEGRERLLAAVKKTLVKLKNSTEVSLKEKLAPLEQRVVALSEKALTEKPSKRQTLSEKQRRELRQETEELLAKIRELENIVADQKASLLEVGSRVHRLETRLRASSGV